MLNLIYQNKNLTALYYLVQFRAFEFCIGAFIVWLLKFSKDMKNSILEVLCLIGIVFILYPVFIYDSETLFPSYNALLPAIGSALIIYAGSAKYMGLIFRVKPIRFIGLISYSLYLVHWPLIVFFKTYNENMGLAFSISLNTKFLIVLLSILIAALMYYFVEQPFRRSIPKSKPMQVSLIVRWLAIILLLTSLGASIFYSKGWLWRANAPIAVSHIDDISKYHQENWGGAGFDGGYIHKGKSRAPAIVMMGDSHSGMLDEGMVKEIGQPNDLTIFTVSGGGAGIYASSLLLPGVTRLDANQTFFDESAKTGYIEAIKKLDESQDSILVYSASYNQQISLAGDLRTHKSWNIDAQNTDSYSKYEPFIAALDRLRKKLNDHKLVLIGDVPGASEYNVMTCITRLKWFTSNSCLSKQLETSTNLGAINVNHILQEYANKHKNVYFINPYNIFCKKGFCINVDDQGTPLYSDGAHLSKAGSIYFIRHVKKELLGIMGFTSGNKLKLQDDDV
ncbi:acyltransferase family protein [Cysteiniphilum marinum]|nr:acyltransferase family protein [Cysteiniphilum marinum]